jgi:hypothetical protein
MNWLVKWGVKKWVLGIANTALAEYNDSISSARRLVARYAAKVEALLAFLRALDAKLADGIIDEGEIEAVVDEAASLGKELCA